MPIRIFIVRDFDCFIPMAQIGLRSITRKDFYKSIMAELEHSNYRTNNATCNACTKRQMLLCLVIHGTG